MKTATAKFAKCSSSPATCREEFEANFECAARTAVVNVTACLRQLRDGLHTFKSKMRQKFNQLIGRRRLSDLAVFKIEPEDERELVRAIDKSDQHR